MGNYQDIAIGRIFRTIVDAVRTAITPRTHLTFGDGFTITDNPAEEETLIEVTGGGGGGGGTEHIAATLAALKALANGDVADGQTWKIANDPGKVYSYSAGTGAGLANNDLTIVKRTATGSDANPGRFYLANASAVVPTYAAARLATSTVHNVLQVQARATAGDFGEGIFYYDSSDTTSADNGGTILVAGTRRYKRRYAGDIDDRWFGASTSLSIDSAPAINAAIQVASANASSTGFAFAGQSVTISGRRRCSSSIIVEGGVTLQGVAGADLYGASALVFDQGVDGVVVEDHTGPNAHSSLGAVVRDLQILQFNKTGSPLADAAPYVNGLYPLVRNKGLNCKAKVHLENLHISGWSGDGLTIAGLNTNCFSMSGFITIDRCFGMGCVITGGETSAGNIAAMLNVFACGSVGIYAHGFLGNNYTGAIHTQGNGYKEVGGVWNHGDVDQVAFIWETGKVVAEGEIILPPPADKNGYVYLARNAGTLALAGAFPAWSTTVGDTFTSGDVEVEVWAVEGTSVWSPGGGVKFNQFTWLYAELDQNPMQLFGNDMMNGGIVDLEIDKNSIVLNGFTRGRKLPTAISTRGATTSGTLNDWAFFLNVEVGGQFASPLTALRFNADYTVGLAPDAAYVGYYCDQGYVSIDWNPVNKRWSHSYGVGWVGKTVCGGRSLPSPGAECFQSLWVGPDLKERRITALPSTSLFLPDFTQATTHSLALGAYQDGDLILNTCGTLETPTQRYPIFWRPTRFGGGAAQGWSGADTWTASHYRRPGECIVEGGNVWRALSEGTSGLVEPSWGSPSSYTTKVDNNFTWEFVGPAGGSFEPVITQAPTMLSKNVAAGGTITLTEDEAAHERVKFTGAPGGALSVVVPAGAGTGWMRTFWNACGQTVTVKGSGGDTGVAVTDGTTVMVFSDGTNCRTSAGTAGTPGAPGADADLAYNSLGITANQTIGFAAASADTTIANRHNQIQVISDGVATWAITCKNAGATQGDRIDFSRPDTEDDAILIKDDGGTTLVSLGPGGALSPTNSSVVFNGAQWIHFGPFVPGIT